MRNSWYKKGFVFVILAVMLLIVPSTLATFNPNVVKTLKNNIKSVDKPDLVILDVKLDIIYIFDIWRFYARVLNDGTGEVPGGTERTLRCVAFSTISGIKVADHRRSSPGAPTPPGNTVNYYLDYYLPDGFGRYKVYFMVDPDDEIDELKEYNNVVWAYYFLWGAVHNPYPMRLSDLHQVSKIPESMPLNIPLILKQLPLDVSMSRNRQLPNTSLIMRILEQFPFLERFLTLLIK